MPHQEFADALPHGGAPRAIVVSGGHVQRYNLLCRELYRLSLQLHEQPAAALGPRARWQRAITAIMEINAARRGGPGAISRLVGGMLQRGDVESTRWCATLLLLQQLGEGLARLQDSMGELTGCLRGQLQCSCPLVRLHCLLAGQDQLHTVCWTHMLHRFPPCTQCACDLVHGFPTYCLFTALISALRLVLSFGRYPVANFAGGKACCCCCDPNAACRR